MTSGATGDNSVASPKGRAVEAPVWAYRGVHTVDVHRTMLRNAALVSLNNSTLNSLFSGSWAAADSSQRVRLLSDAFQATITSFQRYKFSLSCSVLPSRRDLTRCSTITSAHVICRAYKYELPLGQCWRHLIRCRLFSRRRLITDSAF